MSNPNIDTDMDLRADLNAAIEAAEETPDDTGTEGTPVAEAAAPAPAEAVAESAPAPEAAAAAPVPEAAAPVAPAQEAGPTEKPPGSWTPAAREQWAQVPKEVREEVWKREREGQRALTMSQEARRFQTEFGNTIQPFLGFIAAENSTPLKAVQNMMQTAAALRVGTPQQKVDLVAGIIKNFGIDLEMLDSSLAGQQPTANPQAHLRDLVRSELAPVMQLVQANRQREQMMEQQLEAEVGTELDQFMADPKHEFAQDVMPVMIDIMEISSRRGQQMGLTEAYERALLLHEPVRRVIEARKQREAAQQSTTAARRARSASASVVPSAEATVAVPTTGDSIRSSIEAAINAQQGR